MTQGDSAAIDIDLGVIGLGVFHPGHDDGSEGFVDFDEVDVLEAHARLLESIFRRREGRGQHHDRIGGAHAHVRDPRARLEVVFLERLFRNDQQRGGGIGNLTGDASGNAATLFQRLQAGHAFQRGVAARTFVVRHTFKRFDL